MAAILIVEDDKMTNDVICDYLCDAGHMVYQAFDGTEALKRMEEEEVELVILDIMLPHTNGLQVLKEIRKTSMIPVLMLTALSDEGTQISSFDSLADDYITKPLSMVLLGKRVLALLRRSGKMAGRDLWEYEDIKVDFNGYLAGDMGGTGPAGGADPPNRCGYHPRGAGGAGAKGNTAAKAADSECGAGYDTGKTD